MSNMHPGQGNLLNAPVEALVNTVNCVGVMGKGIAYQFSRVFPENSRPYQEACKAKSLRPGGLVVVERVPQLGRPLPLAIVNMATKDHWRGDSKLEWIESGLEALVEETRRRGWRSLAIPPLGCGNGGLRWEDVRPLIEDAAAALPHVQVWLFAPGGTPLLDEIPPAQKAPTMNHTSALYIRLLDRYSVIDLEFSHLEFQKLAYFLQLAGEPSAWTFSAQRYGPAAHGPLPMLRRWDGHWTLGFGDGTGGPRQPMLLKPHVIDAADKYLQEHPAPESEARVERVLRLIEGMDTALGLELLASVHWVASQHSEARLDEATAVRFVHDWNEHKRRTLRRDWIGVAWNRLHEHGWLSGAPA